MTVSVESGGAWRWLAPFALVWAMPGVASLGAQEPPLHELPVVRVAEHDWAPFMMAADEADESDEDGEDRGVVTELLDLCVPAAGFRPEYEFFPIKRAFIAFRVGRLDLNVMSHTADREAFAAYGRVPVVSSTYRPFVRAGETREVRSLADLDGLRLGHLSGLRVSAEYQAYLAQREAQGEVEVVPTQRSLLRMLLAGRIDAFVLPRESLQWRARREGVLDQVREIPLDLRAADYFVTLSRTSPRVRDSAAFLEAIDACLDGLHRRGQVRRLLAASGVE